MKYSFWIIAVFLLGILVWSPNQDTWQALVIERWHLLYFGISAYAIWFLPRWKKCWMPSILVYTALMGGISATYPPFHAGSERELTPYLQAFSGEFLLALASFLLFLVVPLYIATTRTILQVLGLVTLVAVFVTAVFAHPTLQVLFFSNPSMAGVFLALTLFDASLLTRILVTLAIVLLGALTPALVWFAVNFWQSKKRAMWVFLGAALSPLYFLLPKGSDNGRFQLWGWMTEWFSQQSIAHILFGMGPGTTWVWLPVVEQSHGVDLSSGPVFSWLHNDWLQIVLEFGAIGLLLGTFVFYKFFACASKKNQAVLVGFAVAMMTNFPMHWPLHMLVLWAVIREEAVYAIY